jgi:hypothetical protein
MRPVPPTFSPTGILSPPSGISLGLVHDIPTRGWALIRRHPRGLPLQGLHPNANAGKVLVIQDPNRPAIRPDAIQRKTVALPGIPASLQMARRLSASRAQIDMAT